MTARRIASLVTAAICLGGCTSEGDAARPGTSASPSPDTPAEVTAPQAPVEGSCYRLTFEEATEPTNRKGAVDCRRRHQSQTIRVARLAGVVGGQQVAVDSDEVQRKVARDCSRRLADHLGGDRAARALSRFEVVWFTPTVAEHEAGARWYRCDAIALAATDTLAALPRPDRLAGLLDTPRGRAEYGLCGTAAPGEEDFERVICGRKHTWRAIATIPLQGRGDYPGVKQVRRSGDEPCRDRARARAADPLTFRYGWEWPTAEQWQAGQRFGYCWVPD